MVMKHKVKRVIGLLLIAVLMSSVATGCGKTTLTNTVQKMCIRDRNNVEKVFSKKDAKPGDLPYIGKNVFRLERMFLLVIA